MVLPMLLCVRPRDSESEESGKRSVARGLEFLRGRPRPLALVALKVGLLILGGI